MNTTVNFELAKLLKEKGFNEPCRFVHDNWNNIEDWYDIYGEYHRNSEKNASVYYSAPTISDVLDWLYEKHYIWIEVSREYANGKYIYEYFIDINNQEYGFNTPQEAYESAIKKSLEGIKYYDN